MSCKVEAAPAGSVAPNAAAEKPPKPCCVCLDEKSKRDQCLLDNGVDSDKCQPIINQYKSCMKGYGFTI